MWQGKCILFVVLTIVKHKLCVKEEMYVYLDV